MTVSRMDAHVNGGSLLVTFYVHTAQKEPLPRMKTYGHAGCVVSLLVKTFVLLVSIAVPDGYVSGTPNYHTPVMVACISVFIM